MGSIDTAENDEFTGITSAIPSNFSDEFDGFAETLINENNMEYNNMQLDASSAIDLHLYLLSKIEEYS